MVALFMWPTLMFNRLKKLKGIGNSVFESLSFGGVTPTECPPINTLLRVVDTSRNEYDARNAAFFIPYTTYVYADGDCGEMSREDWGLQYRPAGWVTEIRQVNIAQTWDYQMHDQSVAAGSIVTKYETIFDTEDGTGINYAASQGFTYTLNTSIVQQYFDNFTMRWAVWWSDVSKSFYVEDYTMYPTYGTYIQQTSDDYLIYISEADTFAKAGVAVNDNFADGYGGVYKVATYINWIPNNELILTINYSNNQSYDSSNDTNYDNGYYSSYVAKSNGGGGYFTDSVIGGSYFSYGTFVRVQSDTPYYSSWSNNNSYSFANGTYSRVNRIWDGSGGFQNSSPFDAGEYYSYGTLIGTGYYDQYASGPYDLYWGYNGNIYDQYQGGSSCDSYGTPYGVECTYSDGYDAAGSYWTGYWTAQDRYADGSCGIIYNYIGTNSYGCYYPYGYYTTYNDNPSYSNWYVYDSSSNLVAYNSFTYASYGESNMADGSGGNIYNSWNWSMNNGDQIATGEYYDSNYGMTYYYTVYYDGNGGFYVSLSS